jgi:uncharacterized cupredoxin-like copper-binding protein
LSIEPRPATRRRVPRWAVILLGVVALAAVMGVTAVVTSGADLTRVLGGPGARMGVLGGGPVMGWSPVEVQATPIVHAGPGEVGFVAGTQQAPRIVRIVAGPGEAFSPSAVAVAAGETVSFVVTTMGSTAHEFMVGPADAVAGDVAGTPEVVDIAMMETKSITFTFDGPGPYAFACHVPGHYEAGMHGTITVVQ